MHSFEVHSNESACRKKVRLGLEQVPYDICVSNWITYGKKQTVTWHVNDFKSIHVNPKVNDKFTEWCEENYGSDNLGNVKVVRGKIHNYLVMIMDFTQEGALNIDMKYYIELVLE